MNCTPEMRHDRNYINPDPPEPYWPPRCEWCGLFMSPDFTKQRECKERRCQS